MTDSVIPLSEARRRAKRATPPPPPSPEVAPDVTCLGHNKGRYFFAPRGTGQVSVFTSRELSSLGTLIELAPLEYWEREFPGPKGANIMAAANALVRTCQQMGIFDERRFRGRGACWDAGRLVLHLGDRLIADSQSVPVGEFDSHFIYESMASLGIDPAAPALTATEGGRFVDFCKEFRWEKPFMGTLLAGWIATAPISGALAHRPHTWLTGQSGSGKAQSLDSLVLCPPGFRRMGDLRIGDEVIAGNGDTSRIVGVFPQGKKPIFRVTMEDGRMAEFCDDHLFRARVDGYWCTTELRGMRANEGRHTIHLPLCVPPQNAGAELPVDPYVLGALLGDGHFQGPRDAKKAHDVLLSAKEPHIVDRVNAGLAPNYTLRLRSPGKSRHDWGRDWAVRRSDGVLATRGRPGFCTDIFNLGLTGRRSRDKFIPDLYLRASTAQKLELLRGLMDTDGTVSPKGHVSYCSISPVLASQVQRLVWELGGRASIIRKSGTFYYDKNREKVPGQTAYIVFINHPRRWELLTLPRKVERAAIPLEREHIGTIRVDSIEPIGEKECQCIAIDHPSHLYVTNDYIVTHNTFAVGVVKQCLGKLLIDFQSTSTEAAVRQTLAADALPVVFDEAEGDTKAARERRQQIIEYARASSSEDAPPIRKGGHNGRPVEYYPRSPFFYSSINLGLQGEADERRTTVLRLLGREDGGEAATLARLDHFERLKRHRAEVITPDFPARLLARAARNCAVTRKNADIYTRAAAETLGSMGAAVQIGTLLAGAASLHHARIVTLEEARVFIAREGWVSEASGSQDAGLSDHEQLFKLICDSMTTVRLGNATAYDRTFGDLIVNMAMLKTDEQIPRDCADEHLRRSGLMVAQGSEGRGGDVEQWYCWIANQHSSLERMLANTRWAGRWADSLRRVPGAVRGLRPLRFGNSAKVRAVGVPVAAIGEM